MKKKLLILISIFPILSFAQAELWNYQNPTTEVCYDGLTNIQNLENWSAYQTVDGFWNSPVDSAICIDVAGNSYIEIPYSQADLSRPVYLKLRNMPTMTLAENAAYMFHWMTTEMSELDLFNINYCDGQLCDGVRLGISVPDSDTTNTMRWYTQEFFIYDAPWNACGVEFAFCFPTEYFVLGNELKELVFQLNFESAPIDNSFIIESAHIGKMETFCTQTVTESNISNFNWKENTYQFGGNWEWCDIENGTFGCPGAVPYLVAWQGTGFPSESNKYYFELAPALNAATQQTITIEVDEFSTLQLQPFTYFRGALVEGDDSLRHLLDYQNYGEICIGQYLDAIIQGGGHYVHHEGSNVSFMSGRSCMQYNRDASMVVKENASFIYGPHGQGILATYGGSNIYLEKNTELNINCKIIIANHTPIYENENVNIYASQGSKLIFGSQCQLENWSIDHSVKWIIHSNGAYIDLTALDDDEKKHIEIIYDHQPQIQVLNVFGNPVHNDLTFSFHNQTDSPVNYEVLDMEGRKVQGGVFNAPKGYVLAKVETQTLNKAIYILRLWQTNQTAEIKFVKQ